VTIVGIFSITDQIDIMDINIILLVVAALLPAIVLCIYVFCKDRAEKEPIGLLMKLFFWGVLICFPAASLENTVDPLIASGFTALADAFPSQFYIWKYLYVFIDMLFGVALIEEGLKWIILIWLTKKNDAFNSLFDGLIYAVFVSLGFAAFENVLYVINNGWMVALMRAFLSVPGHMFFSVLMGYYYSLWKITDKAKLVEKEFQNKNVIDRNVRGISAGKYIALSLVMPMIAHGFYNFCATVGEVWAVVLMMVFVLFLYWYCFGKIQALSRADTSIHSYAILMVLRKYPVQVDEMKNNLM